MEAMKLAMPVIIYVLLAILIIALIVLVIRLIVVLDGANKLVKNLEEKVNKFNGAFKAIESASEALSFAGSKFSSFVTNTISKLIRKDEEDE